MDLSLVVPGVVFLSVAMLAIGLNSIAERGQLAKERLARYETAGGGELTARISAGVLRDQRFSSVPSLDQLLRRVSLSEDIALDLARASLPLRVGEYLLIRLICALILALIPTLAGLSVVVVFGAALGGFYLPGFYVRRCQQSRLKKLNDQLVDVTTMIANSLKSGYSFIQGLEMVAREMPPPISEEVTIVLMEMNLGSTAEEALTSLTKRVNSYDLDLIVTAMLIQRQVGGNLAEILETISNTIRERVRMLREVDSLTSEARLSSYVVGLMPVFLIGVLSIISRGYMSQLVSNPLGQMLLGSAAIMEIVGFIMLRKMTAIEI